MFGLADRTTLCPGRDPRPQRRHDAVSRADRSRARKGSIDGGADAMMFGPHTAKLLRAAVGTGIDARSSRDAGSYLCNYLSWRAIEAVITATVLASPPSCMCRRAARRRVAA